MDGTPSFHDLTLKIEKNPGTILCNLSTLIDEGIVVKCRKYVKSCYMAKDKELFKNISKNQN